MNWVVMLLLALLSVLLMLAFGALVELFRQVQQIRQFVGLIDRSIALPVKVGVYAADLGLDFVDLAASGRAVLLVLSDSCTTCHELARSLAGHRVSSGALRVVVEGRSVEHATSFLAAYDLTDEVTVSIDHDGSIARSLDLDVTPVLVRFEDSLSISAITVPTVRTLDAALQWVSADKEGV